MARRRNAMKKSMKDEIKGKFHEVEGKVKPGLCTNFAGELV
jgi:hypothetical protein